MMYPILYDSTEQDFTSNGIGVLSDCVSCIVNEELNGAFDLELQYPVNGVLFPEIIEGRYIKCKSNPYGGNQQIFKIYRSEKRMNSVAKFYAQHISYELNGYPIDKLKVQGNADYALKTILDGALLPHKFTGSSDSRNISGFYLEFVSIKNALLGEYLYYHYGEFEFDNFTVIHRRRRGADRGLRIAYGNNLTSLNQNNDLYAFYTGVLPFAKYTRKSADGEDEEVTVVLPDRIAYVTGYDSYPHQRITIQDFSDHFSDFGDGAENEVGYTAVELLRSLTNQWLTRTKPTQPNLSIDLTFEDLSKALEYQDNPLSPEVFLGDTITVEYSQMGIEPSKTRVVAVKYDALKDRYYSLTVGSIRKNIADTIYQLTRR